jgi:hypothetical protein
MRVPSGPEDEGAVQRAERAVDAAERRHLHGLGEDREAECDAEGAQGCEAGRVLHGG